MPISWQMNDPYALHQLLNSKIENNSIFLRHKRREEITRDWRISWHKSHKVRSWGIRRHCPTAASAKCRNSLVAQPMVWFHAKPLALEPISLLLALEPISLFFFFCENALESVCSDSQTSLGLSCKVIAYFALICFKGLFGMHPLTRTLPHRFRPLFDLASIV